MAKSDKMFICFKRGKNGRLIGAKTGTDLETAKAFSERADDEFLFVSTDHEKDESEDDKTNTEEENVSELTVETVCYSTLSSVDGSISPYHQLIELTTIFRYGLQSAGLEGQIYGLVKEHGNEVESGEDYETYEITQEHLTYIQKHLFDMKEVDEGMKILPSSILLSLVATFDSIIGDFARQLLTLNPAKLESSEKTISYRELFNLSDLETTRSRLIDDEISNLLRGSHKKQAEYLENLIETKIVSHYERWPNFIEIFERRNAYAHNNGFASEEYLKKIRQAKYPAKDLELGIHLKLSTSYLHKSVDILTEFLTILSFVAWRKLGEDPSEAFSALSFAAYTHITKRRFLLAIKLLDFALHRQPRDGVSDAALRQMYVNLANAYKKKGEGEKCHSVLKELDWSATSLDFKICLASLNEDVEEVCKLLPNAVSSGDIQKNDIREWPVFDWVREDEKVREAFHEIFGEALIEPSDSAPQNLPESFKSEATNKSVH
ncbi:hypothetical protein [Pontixanthobacter luteolus]|uniref:hypothetical protein n=1 Tax=Pontixanthobacter luteolus TaxID=295089 RepID=UPI0023020BA1|nr:hypothetical protein [Pontixanthobacter luteolus]